jgi:hypothetical protein
LLSTGVIAHLMHGGIMSGLSSTRRIAYFCWALLLVAGLSFNSAQAEALHSGCVSICENECGEGECKVAVDLGCTCLWQCNGGGSGTAICAI